MENDDKHAAVKSKGLWASILYFFPFQLLILHLKKNHLLIFFWFLLFGYVSGGLATKYGVSFLFLYPEYMGEVGFWSHFTIGFAMAGFVTAFNIYSYVIHAFRFPFLATLSKPFYKFSINNFLIPAVFIGYYVWKVIAFQRAIEFESTTDIALHITGFLTGFIIFMGISLLYFYGTNKDVLGFLKANKDEEKGRFADIYEKFVRERIRQSTKKLSQRPWRVESYLKNFYVIAIARGSEHYNEETLRRVFSQNHFNASLFELFLVLTFLLVMNFGDLPIFTIPGGASVILVFTLMLMILSVLLSWFRGWAVTVLVIVVLGANFFSNDLSFLPQNNPLYGLDYSVSPVPYNEKALNKTFTDSSMISRDKEAMEKVLDAWLGKQIALGIEKPKLLIINSSGGGLRSSLWNTSMLCHIDSVLDGELMKKTALMSGASGGMLGQAFLRESYIQRGFSNIYGARNDMERDIAKDILNPVLLSIASSDIFIQFAHFEYQGMEYPKDRAYRFEEQYLNNTGRHLDRSLIEYRDMEAKAEIPMLVMYPTIINDGRKLLISPLDMGFMSQLPDEDPGIIDHQFDFIEFRKLFKEAGADQARFSSLIRANATFPYILPQVSLPSEPPVQLMDAGIRDNYGFTVSFRFIASMREWIEENTSGVVILQVRDKRKDIEEKVASERILSRLTSPLGNVYGNFIKSQDFVHDDMYASMRKWLNVPLDEVMVQMEQPGEANVSMSWHLTGLEKKKIEESVLSPENILAVERLKKLLLEPVPTSEITEYSIE